MKRSLLAVPIFCCVSCVVATLTPEGSKVRVTVNNQETVGCKFVGNIEAPDVNKVGDSTPDLANKAAVLGGTVVLLGRKNGVMQTGEVYRCEPKP